MGKKKTQHDVKARAPSSNWLKIKSKIKDSTQNKASSRHKKQELSQDQVDIQRKELKKQRKFAQQMEGIDTSNIIAMDCEMVGVGSAGDRSVLARCSLVDYHGHVVYDVVVRPIEKVTDFRTHVSGIRSSTIRHGISPHQCQIEVAKHLRGKIVVGHALKNDFQALMFNHPPRLIRDTARYRPFMRQHGMKLRPRALKRLVEEHIGIQIQSGEHDSVEDARSAMKLYQSVCGTWEKHVKLSKNHAGLIGPAPLLVRKEQKNALESKQHHGMIQLENEEQQLIESMLKKKVKMPAAEFMENGVTDLSEFDA